MTSRSALRNEARQSLDLAEFRRLYFLLSQGMPTWAAFLLLGFLVWVEGKTIKTRVKNTVDEAIVEYETLHSPPEVVLPLPVYSETGSDFFDEMRLTAPWVDRERPSKAP
jgi:hypothetical protein